MFYLDDNVVPQVGDELRSLGHEAHTSQGEGLKGATEMAEPLALLDIYRAARRIGPHVRRTPLERSAPLSEAFGAEVWLKLDCWQATGSFKLRGALNALLALAAEGRVPPAVVTASAGNHGLGVAYAAHLVGARATVVVPETASAAKVAALWRTGAALVQHGPDYDAAEARALALARETGAAYVSPYDDPAVVAGQGTVALEVLQELPQADTLLVPAGGGGLLAGVAVAARAINPAIKLVGVQAAASPAIVRALAAGRVEPVEVRPTLADGLAGNLAPETMTLPLIRDLVDDVVAVEEAAIAAAMRDLLAHHQLVVEGAGAVGLAALATGAVAPGRCTVLLLTGRNVAATALRELLQRRA